MNLKFKFDLSGFEAISAGAEGKLVGGFSASYIDDTDDSDGDAGSNNCEGGNCKAGCGGGQNIQCNTVAGCA